MNGLLGNLFGGDNDDDGKPDCKDVSDDDLDDSIRKYLRRQLDKFKKLHRDQIFISPQYTSPDMDKPRKFIPTQPIRDGQAYYVVTGLPGGGKSTALRRFFEDMAKQYLEGKKVPLPLWIDLRLSENTDSPNRLFEYAGESIRCRVRDLVRRRPVLLMLDGLNEMPASNRTARAESIRNWLRIQNSNKNIYVVISCRVRDYEDEMEKVLGVGLPVYELQPFNLRQVERYINESVPIQRTAYDLLQEVRYNDAVRELAIIPLHLKMLTDLSNMEDRLPQRLRDLYDQYLVSRYEYEDKKKNMNLDWDTLHQKLRRLADELKPGSNGNNREGRVRWILSGNGLEDAYNMNLIYRDVSYPNGNRDVRIRFRHQSLQGYFALYDMVHEIKSTRNPNRLMRTVREIGDLGDVARVAVDSLLDVLQSWRDDPEVTHVTSQSLARIGSSAVSTLLQELARPNLNAITCENIIRTLSNIRNVEPQLYLHTLRLLNRQFTRTDQAFRQHIVEVLRGIEDKKHHPDHQQLIENLEVNLVQPHEYQAYLIDAMGRTQVPGGADLLIRLLPRLMPNNGMDIIIALGDLRDPTAIEPLIELAGRKGDDSIQNAIAVSLRKLDERGIRTLFDKIRDEHKKDTARKNHLQTTLYFVHDRDAELTQHTYEEIISPTPDEQYLSEIIDQFTIGNTR